MAQAAADQAAQDPGLAQQYASFAKLVQDA